MTTAIKEVQITFNIVPEAHRSAFPNKHFFDPLFDTKVFNIADQLLANYSDGYWEYIEATVKDEDYIVTAPFLELSDDAKQTLRNPFSGEEFEMDTRLAGIILTSYAAMREGERNMDERLFHVAGMLNALAYSYANQTGQFYQAFGMLD